MKLALTLIMLALVVPTLAACVKRNPAKTEIILPDGTIYKHHCPPGQAKKGRCVRL